MSVKCLSCESSRFESRDIALPVELRGESFLIDTAGFVCLSCGEVLMDEGMMSRLQLKAADAYRKAKGLLTSEEITRFRKRLSLSQEEFADYLSVGIASIKRWEKSGIQEKGQDELIRLKCDSDYAKINSQKVLEKMNA